VFWAALRAIPITAGLLLYYYGHQYLINRYLLNNDLKRYFFFLLLLLIIQSVGSYNINHLLFSGHEAQARTLNLSFGFFFLVNFLFDLGTFIGILATIRVLSMRKKLAEVQTEHKRIRDVFLRGQINHHSLLNTMNSIYYLSITQPHTTSDAILKASDLLKYILVQAEKEAVPVRDELHFISAYIDLQRLRLGTTRQISYESPAEESRFLIPPLLLISLVENACKYAASTIAIRISITHDVLELRCTNDILSNPTDSHGIGLKNLEERLRLIYENDFILQTEEKEGWYYALLKLKLFYD
jgi:LytS/YehU family sensor histidine kinase